ncbi:hypothetical protein ACIQU5_35405 [Streptomyces sp. NPDC090306]|uniref:hypothetical protein n=1 Tax=Streptomyces sp. NPDC090306 TaxID=3365961 RepID=UPI0038046D6E
MPTYHEIMTTDLACLTAAADQWDAMAGEFAKRESQYRRDVHGVTVAPSWLGASADAAHTRFTITLREFGAAQTEAKAVASLLRDAHAQFVELRGRVRAVRHEAVAAGLRVSDSGVVSASPDKDDDARTDNSPCVSASSWQQRLDRAVRDVGDADHGVGIALRSVTVDSDPGDGTVNGFNSAAKGDVEQYEAAAADVLARKLASGGKLSARELAELRLLFRDNDHDTSFSRTFLAGLGAAGTVRMTNRLNDLIHVPGGADGGGLATIESGLARTLATATHDTRSPWYEQWRSDVRRAGVERYDTVFNGTSLDKVRGYQSLVTLMQHGDGYSPQFLSDVGDDIMTAEKADPDVWDLKGHYSGRHGAWFANDPMDGLLGVMSHDPDTAASYLGSDDRMKYLTEERDWRVLMDAGSDNGKAPAYRPALDGDDRAGFGAALQAAATGIDPSDPSARFVQHTKANDAVFRSALTHLARRQDDFPSSLRDPMAHILVNHGDTVHYAASSIDMGASPLPQDQLFEVVKQVSKDHSAYGTLNHEINRALVADIHRADQRYPEESLIRAGRTVGFLEEARAQTASAPPTASFEGKWVFDQAIGYVPVVSGQVQQGFDYVTDQWLADEQKRLDDTATEKRVAIYENRNNQLRALTDEWWSVHGSGGESPYPLRHSTEVSADEGIMHANGVSGGQR